MFNPIKNISIKWVISFLITLFLVSISFAEETWVTANVSVANNKPEIVSITPSFSPVVMWQNVVQSFSIQLKDVEWDNITYTITPDYGANSPISGTINNATKLQNSEAFINFTYLSSNEISEIGSSKITITLNDGTNPVTIQEIDLYIF
jgi:hypothetical protein